MDLEKAEEPEIKLPTSIVSSRKQESSRKTSTFTLLTTPKPLTVWITANCGKFFKRWEYQTTWPVSWETCMQVKKQQLEPDMKQQTGSKLGKEYKAAVYCHSLFNFYTEYVMWNEAQTGKFLKRWEYQSTLVTSWEIWSQIKKQQLELDMEPGLAPNREWSTSRLYIVTLLI